MKSNNSVDLIDRMNHILDGYHPSCWSDITGILSNNSSMNLISQDTEKQNLLAHCSNGTAFITFEFGIDGVSIEISKYAKILEEIYEPYSASPLHMIAGDFQPEASSILRNNWARFQVDGINGWDKWDDGKWFRALFKKEIRSNSKESKDLAKEIFKQAVSIAKTLGVYLIENQITLLIPVNIASNPGNMALTLGVVLISELLGTFVLNSNHDFYWESGKSADERKSGEKVGPRDHFFRNSNHKNFFSLFQSLYPWNGRRWLQVNINKRQSRRLIRRTDLTKEKVQVISTAVDDCFFEPYSMQDIKSARIRMAHILSNGDPQLRSISIYEHLDRLADWMVDQKPLIVGSKSGLVVDPESDELIILLQPTRIIARKRIERDIALIRALIQRSPFGKAFEKNSKSQLILHITGPTPIEHQKDLQKILFAFRGMIEKLPKRISQRIFVAFSVGQEEHPIFPEHDFSPMAIESIYRMANAVVFPSETEGRGLPIIEASAIGIPIICSRYYPKEVFYDVVGKGLPGELQIQYTLFPDLVFPRHFLEKVSRILLSSKVDLPSIAHNRAAVQARYSQQALKKKFESLLTQIANL